MPFAEQVLAVAEHRPALPAVVGQGERLSYSELVADSERLAAALAGLRAAQTAPPTAVPETRGVPITAVSLPAAKCTSTPPRTVRLPRRTAAVTVRPVSSSTKASAPPA